MRRVGLVWVCLLPVSSVLASAVACLPFPTALSEAGLYEDVATGALAAGVREYTPRFELFSDGATKRRFVLLPEGEQIDTSDMDFWRFPTGTKLFKEFTRDDVRVETRMLHKLDSGDWAMIAYLWRPDGSEAVAVPEGTPDAQGTAHDVPALEDCGRCHDGVPDRVLGFTAVQLANDDSALTLGDHVDESLLSDPPADATLALPGTPVEAEVLGYLHANCGACHNENSLFDDGPTMKLWLKTGQLDGDAASTDTFATTLEQETTQEPEGGPALDTIIVPGDPAASMLLERMRSRGVEWQMPPIASEDVDASAATLIESWIEGL
jgi:hypothetical protein